MGIRIYNTLTRTKEEFRPLEEGVVRMYVCGVTVYDLCHIGHARAGVVFDVIYRYLKYRGFRVVYVRNFTDVDDKIIDRANREHRTVQEVAEQYIREFYTDMGALQLEPPTHEPKATEHIAEMIGIIEELIQRGCAYPADGSVYFEVGKFGPYGALSGKRLDDLRSGARVEVDPLKRDPLDFALWKASKPGEPAWASPWGKGRPGWHIECSAMSIKYLGKKFDIHGGGKDLVFPHHENELAQTQASTGEVPIRYWIHNGFVNINEEKMSKSLGNYFTVKDVLRLYHPEVIRLFVLMNHYRSPIDFSDQYLSEVRANLNRGYEFFLFCEREGIRPDPGAQADPKFREAFVEAMDDDFNTAAAIGLVVNEIKRLNQLKDRAAKLKRGSAEFKEGGKALAAGMATLKEAGEVLGLFRHSAKDYFHETKMKWIGEMGIPLSEIESLIAARANARKEKNYGEADRIRDELLKRGIGLKDSALGTEWILTD